MQEDGPFRDGWRGATGGLARPHVPGWLTRLSRFQSRWLDVRPKAASISPIPPQTVQRRWPVPLHSMQWPVVIPAMDRLPVPRQTVQDVLFGRGIYDIRICLAFGLASRKLFWHRGWQFNRRWAAAAT